MSKKERSQVAEPVSHVRVITDKDEVLRASNEAYLRYIGLPKDMIDNATFNHKRWWKDADAIRDE